MWEQRQKPWWCFSKALLCLFTSLLCKRHLKHGRAGLFCANNGIHLMKRTLNQAYIRAVWSCLLSLIFMPATIHIIRVDMPKHRHLAATTNRCAYVRETHSKRIRGAVCLEKIWITGLYINKPEWHHRHKRRLCLQRAHRITTEDIYTYSNSLWLLQIQIYSEGQFYENISMSNFSPKLEAKKKIKNII